MIQITNLCDIRVNWKSKPRFSTFCDIFGIDSYTSLSYIHHRFNYGYNIDYYIESMTNSFKDWV